MPVQFVTLPCIIAPYLLAVAPSAVPLAIARLVSGSLTRGAPAVVLATLLAGSAPALGAGRPRHRTGLRWRGRSSGLEAGQTTAEYALVLLGAATVALLVLAWATRTGKVGQLLNAVVDSIIAKV